MSDPERPPDRPPEGETQGAAPDLTAPWIAQGGWGRLRLKTLIDLRWRGLAGQVLVLSAAALFGLAIPWLWCAPLVLVSVAVNVLLLQMNRAGRTPAPWATAAVLGFDTTQLAILLFLTGGVLNPFAVLLVAPVALGAASLRTRFVVALVLGAQAYVLVLAAWSWPLPEPLASDFQAPQIFRVGVTIALETAIAFTAGYAWRASQEAEQTELALGVTQQVLAREQKLSALGALAAAAAHELGTPLATIQIVSRELARGSDDPALKEDAELLIQQAARCREILQRLTETPEAADDMHDRLSLRQLLNEIIEPYLGDEVRVEAVVSGPPGASAPDIRRLPEVLHAMATFVENAADFARSEVLLRARFDDQVIVMEVHDDGPGFSPEVLSQIGSPYVTSRPEGEGSRTGHKGMGLGFFIAKTLLEKTGATVTHHNARRGGAVVSARWPRSTLEAPALRDF